MYKLQVKTTAPAPASRLGAAPGLPCVLAAPAPASQLGAAPGPSRVTWAPAPPSGSGQLRSCHVSQGRALQAASN
jgi:hypothetical protein